MDAHRTPDYRLSEIRQVTLYFQKSTPSSYLIHESQVDRFLEASKQLHFDPGKNPHNGNETAKVWKITVAKLESRGPYWWTTPGLHNNDDPAGARIIDGGLEELAFIDRAIVDKWDAEEVD